MMRRALAILLFSLAALPAWARNADGTLGVLLTPNNGRPVVVTAGGAFDAMLSEEAGLRLAAADAIYTLPAHMEALPGHGFIARCNVPPETPPGTYALEALSASGQPDRNAHAVTVIAAAPDAYAVAHIAGPAIRDDASAQQLATALAAAQQKATLALVTGPLTANGSPEELQRLIAVLDAAPLPVGISPGPPERSPVFERYFGPVVWSFRYGRDGYLLFNTSDPAPAPDLGQDWARYELQRRALKPCRWVLGATYRLDPRQGLRSIVTLFADDPLDLIFSGEGDAGSNTGALAGNRAVFTPAFSAAPEGFTLSLINPSAIATPRTPK